MSNQITIAEYAEMTFTWAEFNQIEPEQRKARWLQFAAMFPEDAEYWQDAEECHESGACKHENGGWCEYQQFPCSYNPYLSMKTGMVGMACMGMRPEELLP